MQGFGEGVGDDAGCGAMARGGGCGQDVSAGGGVIDVQARTQPLGTGAPCLWLDGERILAAQTNRKLVILSTTGAVEKCIEVRDAPAEVISAPDLSRDAQGRVIYSFQRDDFLIDVPNGVASPLKRCSLGHGLEAPAAVDEQQPRSLYYEGRDIGQWPLNPVRARTAPGVLALPDLQSSNNANRTYSDGVAVWSKHVGVWRTIKMPAGNLIGWSK